MRGDGATVCTDQKEALAKAIMKKAKMDPAPIRKPKFLKIGQIMTTTSLPGPGW